MTYRDSYDHNHNHNDLMPHYIVSCGFNFFLYLICLTLLINVVVMGILSKVKTGPTRKTEKKKNGRILENRRDGKAEE